MGPTPDIGGLGVSRRFSVRTTIPPSRFSIFIIQCCLMTYGPPRAAWQCRKRGHDNERQHPKDHRHAKPTAVFLLDVGRVDSDRRIQRPCRVRRRGRHRLIQTRYLPRCSSRRCSISCSELSTGSAGEEGRDVCILPGHEEDTYEKAARGGSGSQAGKYPAPAVGSEEPERSSHRYGEIRQG